jgi:hypothetical protein
MRTKPLLPLAFILALLTPMVVSAQWAVNGNPVATPTGAQDWISMTANGLGGAVMVWHDARGGADDIYAQQVGQLGGMEWTGNGVALCTATGGQLYPQVMHDGWGYLQYLWQDFRSGTADIYLATTDRLGNIFTPANGLPLCTAAGAQGVPSMALYAPVGLFFATWTDERNGNRDVYYSSFSQQNGITTAANGVAVCTLPSAQEGPVVATRTGGHGVIAWQDFRNGNYDIYAESVGFTGAIEWAANGVVVCTQAAPQVSPMIVDDGVGGAIIAWNDRRNGTLVQSLYAQHLDSAGNRLWAADGVLIAASTDLIILPKMIPDGAGGAIIAWEDDRNISTTGPDIYAQRVNGNGTVLWAANGALVCSASFAQYGADLASDGAGGAVISWFDYRGGLTDVYAQRLNNIGSPLWAANGIPVGAATGNQSNAHIVQSEPGAYIASWEDRRNFGTTDTDVYAQRITNDAAYGYPAPFITSIVDVPGDQGGFVRLTFKQGDGQAPGEEFEIHDVEYHGDDIVWVGTFNGSPTYTVDVLTTDVGVPNTYHVLAAYESNLVSGTSIDNIAPPAPTMTGYRNGNNAVLSWNSTAPDIDHYVIQRADLGDFNVTGTTYTDVGIPMTAVYYRMHAVDIHGNSSTNSNQVTIDAPTGIGDTPSIPKELTLLPNSPNPFSGSTALHIGLPKTGEVRLEVYDVAGRRVVARNVGQLAAGWREVAFDGRADNGQPLASGVYFYRVYAGNETHTRKMVISR